MMPKRANTNPVKQLIFTTHMGDPANARYLVQLENEADEKEALELASITYNAYAEHFSPDITEEECDQVFEQALVDMRRVLCDPDYECMLLRLG
jgi:hypothetical protein